MFQSKPPPGPEPQVGTNNPSVVGQAIENRPISLFSGNYLTGSPNGPKPPKTKTEPPPPIQPHEDAPPDMNAIRKEVPAKVY